MTSPDFFSHCLTAWLKSSGRDPSLQRAHLGVNAFPFHPGFRRFPLRNMTVMSNFFPHQLFRRLLLQRRTGHSVFLTSQALTFFLYLLDVLRSGSSPSRFFYFSPPDFGWVRFYISGGGSRRRKRSVSLSRSHLVWFSYSMIYPLDRITPRFFFPRRVESSLTP